MAPSLFNANPEVRLLAIEVIVLFYQKIGDNVRQATMRIEGLRPNLFQLLMTRMDEVDNGEYNQLQSQRSSSSPTGKFQLEGTSPNQALKAKADQIAA